MNCAAYASGNAREFAGQVASGGARGKYSPIACIFTQDAAENCAAASWRLAGAGTDDTVTIVAAGLPQGSETHRLYRYPSPVGRRCIPKCAPPIFLFISKQYGYERSFAQNGLRGRAAFDGRAALASCERVQTTHNTRGTSCADPSNRFSSCRLSARLRPAAAPRPSRPCSVQAPVRARRPFWTVTSLRALSLAQRAMSPIARPSRIAASSNPNAAVAAARATHQGPSVPLGAGGLLHFRPGACARGAGTTTKGDTPCSRRS